MSKNSGQLQWDAHSGQYVLHRWCGRGRAQVGGGDRPAPALELDADSSNFACPEIDLPARVREALLRQCFWTGAGTRPRAGAGACVKPRRGEVVTKLPGTEPTPTNEPFVSNGAGSLGPGDADGWTQQLAVDVVPGELQDDMRMLKADSGEPDEALAARTRAASRLRLRHLSEP